MSKRRSFGGIFWELATKMNARLALDLTYLEMDLCTFNNGADCKEFYGDIKELIPLNVLEERRKEVEIIVFIDLDHTG